MTPAISTDIGEQPAALLRALDSNQELLEALRRRPPLRIRFAAHGSSRHAATFGAGLIEQGLGVPCDVLPPPRRDLTFVIRPEEVLVAISQSGQTPSVLAVADRARSLGATVIAVTNEPGSQLEAMASATLACAAGPERAIPATKSFLCQAGLLLAVAAGPPTARVAASAVAAVLASPPTYVIEPELIVGTLAEEAALKFAEIAGLPACGHEAAEALHGPVAAGYGLVLALAVEQEQDLSRLRELRHVQALVAPEGTSGPVAALATLVQAQILAVNLAIARGRNPDQPPGLAKVTLTA